MFDRIGYKRSTITIAVCVCLGVTALPLLQFLGELKDQIHLNKNNLFSSEENSLTVKVLWTVAIMLIYMTSPGIYAVLFHLSCILHK